MTENPTENRPPHSIEDQHENKFLSFPLGELLYGIDIQYIQEVVIWSEKIEVTEIPDMPPYTKGVINLRGKVIPVIDLRERFQLPPQERDYRTCFVVVDINNHTNALIVDTVSGVLNIAPNAVDPAPQLDTSYQSQFIAGMGKTNQKVYILLDLNQLIPDDDFTSNTAENES